MFRQIKSTGRAFSRTCEQLPQILRVTADLRSGRRPSDEDMKALNLPNTFNY